jgi:hypothetical protein
MHFGENILIVLFLPEAPFINITCDCGTQKSSAIKLQSALFALPSTGGVCNRILSRPL